MTPRAQPFQASIREGRPGIRAAVIGASLLVHAAVALVASRPAPPRPPPLPAAIEVAFVKPRPPPVAALIKRPAKPLALRASREPRRAAMTAARSSTPAPPRSPVPLRAAPTSIASAVAPRPLVLSGFTVSAVSSGSAVAGSGTTVAVRGAAISTSTGGSGGGGTESDSQPPVVLNAGSVDIHKYYPPGALKNGFEGAVGLKLVIDADGTIVGASVTRDPGEGLGEAALRAVREFRFSAGRVDGERVRAVVPFVIRFVIHL